MTPYEIRNEKFGPRVVEALKRRHFDAYYCSTKEDALKQALQLIPEGVTVSWGGSSSIEEIGLKDAVKNGNYEAMDRDATQTPEERWELMRQALLCHTYITGTNALSEDGQLVNIDGNGNRVAAMTFGPQNVIVIAGINKIAKTVDDAASRARNTAAPINIQRFGDLKTPCTMHGYCGDCITANCACAYFVTTRISRPPGKIKVIIVGEPLGF